MSENLPAKWRKVSNGIWQYHAPGYAVYATVSPLDDGERWAWDARVMHDCIRLDGNRTSGVAKTKEGAMKIVEVVCSATGTCEPYENPMNLDGHDRPVLEGVEYTMNWIDAETISLKRAQDLP
jgi:hypothetical protein